MLLGIVYHLYYKFLLLLHLDHCQFPNNESDSQILPVRKLRSQVFQLCSNCNQPIEGKIGQQNICMCLSSTPTTVTQSQSLTILPKKRSKNISHSTVMCKRQLFDENEDSTKDEKPTLSEFIDSNSSSIIDTEETQQKLPAVNQILKGRHSCQVCLKSFTSPCKLTQHSYSHTGEKPFACKYCLKAFSSKFKLVRHALIHSDQRQYHCTICDRTFHRKDHLKNHSKVHNPIKRIMKCDRPDCSKEYSSVLSYRKHIAIHSVDEGFLDCKICNKVFESKDELMYHLKIHSGSRVIKTPADKKYHCSFCDRSFYTGKDVRRHLVVHTGLRDFLCQYCPQRFGRKDHLTRHIKKSHNINTSKKPKLKKTSELHKNKSVDSIYLEAYDESHKVKKKLEETVTSGSLIKQENSQLTDLEIFNLSDISSFDCSENNSGTLIQTAESSSETNLSSINFDNQMQYSVNELKVFDNPDLPGLSQLINLMPSNIDETPEVLTCHESTILMANPSQQTEIEREYFTSSSEILSALLSQTSETENAPLPGFNQVFNNQQ